MSGTVKATEAAAVLALSAAMGKARGALLALLQSETPCSPARVADAGAFTVGALSIGFSHGERTP